MQIVGARFQNGAPRNVLCPGTERVHTFRPAAQRVGHWASAMSPFLASQARSEGWFRSRMIMSRWSSHLRVPLASAGDEPPNAPLAAGIELPGTRSFMPIVAVHLCAARYSSCSIGFDERVRDYGSCS